MYRRIIDPFDLRSVHTIHDGNIQKTYFQNIHHLNWWIPAVTVMFDVVLVPLNPFWCPFADCDGWYWFDATYSRSRDCVDGASSVEVGDLEVVVVEESMHCRFHRDRTEWPMAIEGMFECRWWNSECPSRCEPISSGRCINHHGHPHRDLKCALKSDGDLSWDSELVR